MKDFEILYHMADIKLRVYGNTLEELFKHALAGMFQSIHPINSKCHYKNNRIFCPNLNQKRSIDINSFDLNTLLVDFLSEALYLSDINNEAYLDVNINELSTKTIKAILKGIKIKGFEVVEIKAVTYHLLNIKKIKGIWQTDIVFDI